MGIQSTVHTGLVSGENVFLDFSWEGAGVSFLLKYCRGEVGVKVLLHVSAFTDQTISSDKDAKARELTVLLWSSEEIFLRKFSFLVRHNAVADPSPITVDAGVLEYHLGSFRSLLLSSLKKESSVCIEFCERHQFSAPYRRIGRMQVSTTEQPDWGERTGPRNEASPYTPVGKEGFPSLHDVMVN